MIKYKPLLLYEFNVTTEKENSQYIKSFKLININLPYYCFMNHVGRSLTTS